MLERILCIIRTAVFAVTYLAAWRMGIPVLVELTEWFRNTTLLTLLHVVLHVSESVAQCQRKSRENRRDSRKRGV